MYLLGRVQMIAPLPYEEGVKRLMAHGFDGIEFGVSDRQFKPRPEFFSPGFAGEMKSVIQRYGVKAYSVSAHMDYTANDENFQTVYNAIRIAKEMDSPLVIINGAVKNDDEPYEVQWAKQIEYTKRLCDYAQTLGIELAMSQDLSLTVPLSCSRRSKKSTHRCSRSTATSAMFSSVIPTPCRPLRTVKDSSFTLIWKT